HMLVKEGKPLNAICNYLNERNVPTPRGGSHWRKTSIYHMLKSETVSGVYRYSGIEVVVPPIVSREMHEAAVQRLQRNKELATRNSKRDYLLKSFLRCASCGNRYHGTSYRDQGAHHTEHVLYGCMGRTQYRHP